MPTRCVGGRQLSPCLFEAGAVAAEVLVIVANAMVMLAAYHVLTERGGLAERVSLVADLVPSYLALGFSAALLHVYLGHVSGQYALSRLARPDAGMRGVGTWAVTAGVLLSLLYLFKAGASYSRGWMVLWFASVALALPACRAAVRAVRRRSAARGRVRRRRIAIVGATEQAERFLERLDGGDAAPLHEVIGVFDDRRRGGEDGRLRAGAPEGQRRGTTADLLGLARAGGLDTIVIALPHLAAARIHQLLATLSEAPADLFLAPDLAVSMLVAPRDHPPGDPWSSRTLIRLHEQPHEGWNGAVKWTEDKLVAGLALFLTLPATLLIALLIRLDTPGPILFRQTRFGFNNRPFEVLKFRTMHHHLADPTGARQTVRDDPRVTRVGRVIRRLSLDELPQLLNVLAGDMSIVGPRAHAVDMRVLDRSYHEAVQSYAARHRVKPGLTGLAQVHGLRGEIRTMERAHQRIDLDLEYIRNWSLWLDIKIIFLTLFKLPFDGEAY